MYKTDSYEGLSCLDVATLRVELNTAKNKLDYYRAYLNGEHTEGAVNYEAGFNGVKSCERYIIEIERRLGSYSERVSTMLLRWRHKRLQTKGVQLSAASVAETPATKAVMPAFGVRRFRKYRKGVAA